MGTKKRMLLVILLLQFFIFSPFPLKIEKVRATEFYADLEIVVDNAGYVSIDGETNYPNLMVKDSEEFTYKEQSLWTLNISMKENFSDFVFSITLPDNTEINSVLSSATTRIGEESGNLIITGYGTNQPLSIVVLYQTDKLTEESRFFGLDFLSLFLISIIIILTVTFFVVLLFYNNITKQPILNKNENSSQKSLKGLNERQQQIMNLLLNVNSALTQTEIQRELDMPKASVSRNIRRLELKGLIEKEQIGMSNLIRLKKP
jgi:preprotein translocase subunit SecG